MASPEEQLMVQLSQSPIADVLGVVQAGGISGGSSERKGYWILLLTFDGWKYAGGEIYDGELTIRREVTEKELNSIMRQFAPYDCVRVRARVAEQNAFGNPQGLLVEIIGKVSEADLRRYALKLQEPVTFEDEQFGVFTLDRRVDWYEAVVPWVGLDIRLTLSPDEGEDVTNCLTTARAIWDLQSTWHDRVGNYVVTELLALKNDTWLDDGEAALSPEQFKNRLTLNSITVRANGDFEFWYDDGDLFSGHSIRVAGSLSKGPTDAGIEG